MSCRGKVLQVSKRIYVDIDNNYAFSGTLRILFLCSQDKMAGIPPCCAYVEMACVGIIHFINLISATYERNVNVVCCWLLLCIDITHYVCV